MKEELKNPTPTEDKSITIENEESNPKTVIQVFFLLSSKQHN